MNYFVAGAGQMLNLVSQNNDQREEAFPTYPKVAQYHINLFLYTNTYTRGVARVSQV